MLLQAARCSTSCVVEEEANTTNTKKFAFVLLFIIKTNKQKT